MALRSFVVPAAVALVVSSCTQSGETPQEPIPRGGTLRLAMLESSAIPFPLGLDPQADFRPDVYELHRCCLLRTLLSYSGRPTGQGGALLRPDIAEALPEVSADGLTWTFRLKRGLRYGPPLTETEIVAPDFVRSLERMARVGGNKFYFSVIEGFDNVTDGSADSITGVETPDPHTLVFHLTERTGNFGYRMSLPEVAPIPTTPSGAGADEGQDDYGPFLVSSGPYSVEGSEEIDFSLPPEQRQPASGFVKDTSLTLVRNPSWRPGTDPLRPAYADRIEGEFLPPEEAATRVHRGEADVLMFPIIHPEVPAEIRDAYRTDASLQTRLLVGSSDSIRYISLNLATPPLDDIHVRRAINYALDKAQLLEIFGGFLRARPIGHIIHDSMENNLLSNYDPYSTPGRRGDIAKAREEMAQSRYDADGDGVCDDPSCQNLLAVANQSPIIPAEETGEALRSDLDPLGIMLDVRVMPVERFFEQIVDPRNHIPMVIGVGWSKGFPNAEDFVGPLFSRAALEEGCCNYSLVGATPQELRRWGYDVTSVPSVEDKIGECHPLVGIESIRCYAELDQLLSEQVVPWVPLISENSAFIVSDRVVAKSFDQFAVHPALDRIALAPGTT
jgi:peptide/nickel transport system substrate-binding protein